MSDMPKDYDGSTDYAKTGVIDDWQNYSEEYNVKEGNTDEQEEQFHKEQEQLFQEMSKNFALGRDAEASELRNKLKENITQEYRRMSAKLEYVPPRLPEIQNEMKEGIQVLEKNLMDNSKEEYDNVSGKLWDLRREMETIQDDMENKKSQVQEKIETFRKKYGNLVPQQQNQN